MKEDTLTTLTVAELATLPIFPFADAFPYISDDEMLELAQDIEENGLIHSIVLFEGQILDGRNRLRALLKTTLTDAPTKTYTGDDPAGFVVSQNLHRRHLSVGQRAMLALEYEKYVSPGAGARTDLAPTVNSPEVDRHAREARQQAAEKFGIGGQAVSRAKRLSLNAPELAEAVRSGEKSLNEAYSEMERIARAANDRANGIVLAPEEQARRDVARATQSQAEKEIDELIAEANLATGTGAGGGVVRHSVPKEKALGDALRLIESLDKIVALYDLTDQDVLEFPHRPHTLVSRTRRLADWLDLVAAALEIRKETR